MFEAMKARDVATCEARVAAKGTDAEQHGNRLALIVARAKPVGAYITEQREAERMAYNHSIGF